MALIEKPPGVLPFPSKPKRNPSSVEKIWGKDVVSHGFAALPSILIRGQKRLGLNPIQMNIVIQLLDYWREPGSMPYPTKKDLADRINVTPKTIQNNMRQLEKAGMIVRQYRKTASGDYKSNVYDLHPLVAKVKALEPDFQAERAARTKARKDTETPVGLRTA